MPIAVRPAHVEDFDFCARLYFSTMEKAIQELKLDMVAQAGLTSALGRRRGANHHFRRR
jgi:hypothetical protein